MKIKNKKKRKTPEKKVGTIGEQIENLRESNMENQSNYPEKQGRTTREIIEDGFIKNEFINPVYAINFAGDYPSLEALLFWGEHGENHEADWVKEKIMSLIEGAISAGDIQLLSCPFPPFDGYDIKWGKIEQILVYLKQKRYPVPNGLIESIEKGNGEKVITLWAKFRDNILFLANGKGQEVQLSPKLKVLRKAIPIFKRHENITISAVMEYSSIKTEFRKVGEERDNELSDKTKKNWLRDARKEAGVTRKPGRPPKK